MNNFIVSRRTALKGAAAGAVGIVAVGLLSGCKHRAPSTQSGTPVVVQKSAGIDILKTFKEGSLALKEQAHWTLPVETLLFPSQGSWVPALTPGATPDIVNAGGLLSTTSGKLFPCLPAPMTKENNWVIYKIAASDSVFAWVELQIFTRAWKLFAQGHKDGALIGKTVKLWEASPNYEPAAPVCASDQVIWQVMPTPTGTKRQMNSYCYVWNLGGSDARAFVESAGRFGCDPEVSGTNLVLCPRAQSKDGTFYAISAYSLGASSSNKALDSLVLPQGVRPMNIGYFGRDFVFSIEASYTGRGLLGQLGTYIGHGSGPFLYLAREPWSTVAGSASGVYVVKNRASYFLLDTKNKQWSTLNAADGSVDYGEFPARSGLSSDFLSFATIKDPGTGAPASVLARHFSL